MEEQRSRSTLEKVLHSDLLCLLYSHDLFHGLWDSHQYHAHPVGHDSSVRTAPHDYAAAVAAAAAGVEAEEGEEKKSPGSS